MSSGMRGGFGRSRSGQQGGGYNLGGGNMQQMLKQAQRMQSEMQKEQEEINETEFEATSGGGAVVIKMKGDKTLLSIDIKPEVVDPDDVEMLQDLIIAAFSDATTKIDEYTHEKMDKYTAALGG